MVSTVPTVNLSASPDSLSDAGGTVHIRWDVALATSCKATDGDAAWRNMSGLAEGGNLPWTLTETTTFSLECFNGVGGSSGKKSVIVAVGAVDLCGNGILNSGEQCDEGPKNDDTCLLSGCSETCQLLGGQICSSVCGNGRVDAIFNPSCSGDGCWEACDNGEDNGTCPSLCSTSCNLNGNCVDGMTVRINASPTKVDPGRPTDISWSTTNAVSCTASGDGFSGSIGVSGSQKVTVASPPKTYSVACTDKYGQTLEKSIQIGKNKASVNDNIEDLKDFVRVVTLSPIPNYIPFGGGEVTVRYKVAPVDSTKQIPDTLRCSLNKADKLVREMEVKDNIAVNVGKNDAQTYFFEGDYVDEQVHVVGKYGDRTVTITYKCTAEGYAGEVGGSIRVLRQSDPAKAPETLFFAPAGRNEPRMDSNSSSLSLTVAPGDTTYANFGVFGAERCEATGWTLPKIAAGSSYFFDGGGIVQLTASQEGNVFSFECWNGTLSTRKSIIVKEVLSSDGGSTGGQGSGSASGTSGGTRADGGSPANRSDVQASLISITNPLSFNTVQDLLNSILGFLQGIIAILSLIMIVIGSLVYMTAAGDDKKLGTGKMIITASLIGLALALAAPSFLKQIGEILGWGTVDGTDVAGAKTLLEILQTALNFLLSIVGIIAIIMLVVGGLMYLLSAGDEDRMKTGKSIVIYSLIGIAVALAALVLVTQVARLFG